MKKFILVIITILTIFTCTCNIFAEEEIIEEEQEEIIEENEQQQIDLEQLNRIENNTNNINSKLNNLYDNLDTVNNNLMLLTSTQNVCAYAYNFDLLSPQQLLKYDELYKTYNLILYDTELRFSNTPDANNLPTILYNRILLVYSDGSTSTMGEFPIQNSEFDASGNSNNLYSLNKLNYKLNTVHLYINDEIKDNIDLLVSEPYKSTSIFYEGQTITLKFNGNNLEGWYNEITDEKLGNGNTLTITLDDDLYLTIKLSQEIETSNLNLTTIEYSLFILIGYLFIKGALSYDR